MRYNELFTALQNLTGFKKTQQEVADVLKITQPTLAGKISRKSEIKKDDIELLEQAFNVDLSSSIQETDSAIITYRPDVFLSAGYGVEVYDETKSTMTFDARLLVSERGNKINPANCEIVSISGNSMFPEYRHGDKVIIDRSDIELSDGQIFALRYDGKCFVKEINLLGDKIKCISLNKEYDPFYINKNEDYTVLGRILPRIRL